MENLTVLQQSNAANTKAVRLYYLDWLRVLATLGVFLFHVSDVFSGADYEVVNSQSSELIFIITSFFYPWGLRQKMNSS